MELVVSSPGPADPPAEGQEARSAADVKAARPSFEALYRDHFDTVYRLVGRLLGPGASAADVEDLTQQSFLAAHRALPRFRGESKPSTWLCGIAVRTVNTWLRGWRRRRRLLAALAAEPMAPPATDHPAVELERRELLQRTWRRLLRMSAKKRAVYLLYEVEGLSGAEIAEALGVPVATVWTRLYHARRELLRGLEREESK